MSKNKFLIITGIVFLSGLFMLATIFGIRNIYISEKNKPYSNAVIKLFLENKEEFEKAIIDIEDDSFVIIENNTFLFNISYGKGNNDNIVFHNLYGKFKKYKKIFNLMKKYKIKKISKLDGNIKIVFKSNLRFSESIANIKDKEKYISNNSKPDKIIQIYESWYYLYTEAK